MRKYNFVVCKIGKVCTYLSFLIISPKIIVHILIIFLHIALEEQNWV